VSYVFRAPLPWIVGPTLPIDMLHQHGVSPGRWAKNSIARSLNGSTYRAQGGPDRTLTRQQSLVAARYAYGPFMIRMAWRAAGTLPGHRRPWRMRHRSQQRFEPAKFVAGQRQPRQARRLLLCGKQVRQEHSWADLFIPGRQRSAWADRLASATAGRFRIRRATLGCRRDLGQQRRSAHQRGHARLEDPLAAIRWVIVNRRPGR
jgi:catalase (peroxidase I)